MKANELMIRDWVDFYHPYEPEKKIVTRHRVTEIFECGLVGINNLQKPLHADYIEPIKITPEILEKNGFVLKEDEKGAYGVDIAPYYTRDDVPFEVFCDGEPFAIWFKDPINIKYVHQLQHALHLCGIEKEIVL